MTISGRTLGIAARAALIAALGVTVYGMMAITFVDVAGRYLFNAPLGGAKELTEVLLALMVFGAAPLVAATRSHITTALFESALKGGVLRFRNGAIAVATPHESIRTPVALNVILKNNSVEGAGYAGVLISGEQGLLFQNNSATGVGTYTVPTTGWVISSPPQDVILNKSLLWWKP